MVFSYLLADSMLLPTPSLFPKLATPGTPAQCPHYNSSAFYCCLLTRPTFQLYLRKTYTGTLLSSCLCLQILYFMFPHYLTQTNQLCKKPNLIKISLHKMTKFSCNWQNQFLYKPLHIETCDQHCWNCIPKMCKIKNLATTHGQSNTLHMRVAAHTPHLSIGLHVS